MNTKLVSSVPSTDTTSTTCIAAVNTLAANIANAIDIFNYT